jgi:Raf kinase inhibitor-like YbhB/YbcL family protein
MKMFLIYLPLGVFAACSSLWAGDTAQPPKVRKLKLISPSFAEGQPIPVKYTGRGEDVSPALQWSEIPPGTKSLALICDDPDAPVGTWVHWFVFDIPETTSGLTEKVPTQEKLADGTTQGVNDFGRIGYGGPNPPPGKAHRYYFKLYALDQKLNLKPRATKQQVVEAMEAHILGQGELMGTFKR